VSNNLYQDRDARLNTVVGDDAAYWAMLSRIADEWPGLVRGSHGVTIDARAFGDWCEKHHGFRAVYDSGGGITGKPDIIDSQKYMLCVLKYSG
jgi:hypothetical protein